MAVTSTPFNVDHVNRLVQGFRRMGFAERLNEIQDDVSNVDSAAADLSSTAIAVLEFPYTGQPTAEETLVIGGDTYQAIVAGGSVTNDAYIAFLRGATARATYLNLVDVVNAKIGLHTNLFKTDDVTPALAAGTENVRMEHVAGGDTATGKVYLFNADAPGGNKLPGAAPSLVVSDSLTNGGPWKLLNLNLAISAAAQTKYAAVPHTIVAGDLSQAQPVLVAVPFTPSFVRVTVVDANGVQRAPYIEATIPAAIGGQDYVALNLNDTTPTGPNKTVVTHDVAASTAREGYFSPPTGRDIRIVGYELILDEAVAGGTLVGNIKKTTAAGAETDWATAVNVAGFSAHDPTAFTPDDVALPHDLAATESVMLGLTAGVGLTAPLNATWNVLWAEKVVDTDKLLIEIWGA